jgi:hypothetical protein
MCQPELPHVSCAAVQARVSVDRISGLGSRELLRRKHVFAEYHIVLRCVCLCVNKELESVEQWL